MKTLDIAIAGAGPAGLATALYLHRLGHRVRIFERFAAAAPIGSGLILQPTGLAVLDDLGLHAAIAALGQPLDRLIGTDAVTGRLVLDVRYAALPRQGRGLGTHRAALFNVLHRAVQVEGLTVDTSRPVTGFEDRRLRFGSDRAGPFDLVVDCLGAGSPLRVHAAQGDAARPLPYGALWATTPWVEGFDGKALMQRYRAARVMIGVLPIGRQTPQGPRQAAFFWSLRTEDYERVVAWGIEAWKAEVISHWPETASHLARIAGFGDLALAKYGHHTLRLPAGEGIVFVGDSAHSTSPQLGQGANMALLDARALFVALRDAADVPEALSRYAALRRWHVRLYQWLSLTLTPFYQSDSRMLPPVRDFLVSVVGRVPPAPQLLAMMVAGTLLSPLNRLGLKLPPQLEG